MNLLARWKDRALQMMRSSDDGGQKVLGAGLITLVAVFFVGAVVIKGLIAVIAFAGSGGTQAATSNDVARNSSSPIRIEVMGANGRWTYAGSANEQGAAVHQAMERALRARRDANKARAVDQRSGAVVDFTHG
ncbi:hypothetical protein [Polycyclovorans algicola]|uniref:hypothetical protein n=1 Tax=Polycyclovorans algicola TaxID=616992 RepID=UPI0004A6F2F2|nr:hypothetical protein [Polycyclovorans algicola]